MNFKEWLRQPEPEWKNKLEACDPRVFEELAMDKEDVKSLLEKLNEHEVI